MSLVLRVAIRTRRPRTSLPFAILEGLAFADGGGSSGRFPLFAFLTSREEKVWGLYRLGGFFLGSDEAGRGLLLSVKKTAMESNRALNDIWIYERARISASCRR